MKAVDRKKQTVKASLQKELGRPLTDKEQAMIDSMFNPPFDRLYRYEDEDGNPLVVQVSHNTRGVRIAKVERRYDELPQWEEEYPNIIAQIAISKMEHEREVE